MAAIFAGASAIDAEAALLSFDPQVLVTDIEMPGNDGIVLLQTLRSRLSTLPAIAVSGHDDASRPASPPPASTASSPSRSTRCCWRTRSCALNR